jgi:hypothetical protein
MRLEVLAQPEPVAGAGWAARFDATNLPPGRQLLPGRPVADLANQQRLLVVR